MEGEFCYRLVLLTGISEHILDKY